MTISLHTGHVDLILRENQLIVLTNASEDDYWKLSSEDVKVEFAEGDYLYIHQHP
ncbi:MAG: hypothetical protein INQ03_04240 [Candidatus Heimdallarchaeota archaeon]|nr:hypothetical protein [Candidatus Heimdallarchaeota archaeon]